MKRALFSTKGRRELPVHSGPLHHMSRLPIPGLRRALRQWAAKAGGPIMGVTVVLALLAVGVFGQAALADPDICGYPVDGRATILRDGHPQAAFAVSLAESTTRHQRGLMHCPHLPFGHGMLFVYQQARPRVFWMKNTPLALAIIFVTGDGRIVAVEKGAPQSLTRIPSPGPVRYVLEINPAEARGLRIGDHLQWHRIGTAD